LVVAVAAAVVHLETSLAAAVVLEVLAAEALVVVVLAEAGSLDKFSNRKPISERNIRYRTLHHTDVNIDSIKKPSGIILKVFLYADEDVINPQFRFDLKCLYQPKCDRNIRKR